MAQSNESGRTNGVSPWLWMGISFSGTVLTLSCAVLAAVIGIRGLPGASAAKSANPPLAAAPVATPHPMPPAEGRPEPAPNPSPNPAPEPGTVQDPENPAPVPAEPLPVPPVRRVLYQDDMAGARKLWPAGTFNGGAFVQYYQNGEYHIDNRSEMDLRNVDVPLRYVDMVYEVDLRKVAGRDDGFYGLMFRLHELESYFFLISGDGHYQLVRHVGHGNGQGHPGGGDLDGWDLEGMIPATDDTAGVINRGDAGNRLKVYAIGPVLTIFINDLYVGQVVETKPDFHWEGMIGMYVDSGVHIAVDAMRVFEPGS